MTTLAWQRSVLHYQLEVFRLDVRRGLDDLRSEFGQQGVHMTGAELIAWLQREFEREGVLDRPVAFCTGPGDYLVAVCVEGPPKGQGGHGWVNLGPPCEIDPDDEWDEDEDA